MLKNSEIVPVQFENYDSQNESIDNKSHFESRNSNLSLAKLSSIFSKEKED